MISIDSGADGRCKRCGVGIDTKSGEKYYCPRCWDKHYSTSAIREKRLKKLLSKKEKKWWEFW